MKSRSLLFTYTYIHVHFLHLEALANELRGRVIGRLNGFPPTYATASDSAFALALAPAAAHYVPA